MICDSSEVWQADTLDDTAEYLGDFYSLLAKVLSEVSQPRQLCSLAGENTSGWGHCEDFTVQMILS